MRNETLLTEYREKFFQTLIRQVEAFLSRSEPKYLLEVTIKRRDDHTLPIMHFPFLERHYRPASETVASHVTLIYPPNIYKEQRHPKTGRIFGSNRPQATNEPISMDTYKRIRELALEYPDADANYIASLIVEPKL